MNEPWDGIAHGDCRERLAVLRLAVDSFRTGGSALLCPRAEEITERAEQFRSYITTGELL